MWIGLTKPTLLCKSWEMPMHITSRTGYTGDWPVTLELCYSKVHVTLCVGDSQFEVLMKSVWHACCSFMSVCFICLEKWINIMQGFRELRNPMLTWDIHVIVWRCGYHDVCENLWPLLLHGEDSHWIYYKIFRFHKSTKVVLKILHCFSRMISVITMIQIKYVLNTRSENCQMIMSATWPFSVKQNVFICALQIM